MSGSGGGTGPYGFRLITSKERRQDAAVGDQISGRLDVPGRTDLYAIQAAGAAKLYLAPLRRLKPNMISASTGHRSGAVE